MDSNDFIIYNVPKNLQQVAKCILYRFNIYGTCDPMYICNVIAHSNNIGDGESHFTGMPIVDEKSAAYNLSHSYGCNIHPEDFDELCEIIRTGTIIPEKTEDGFKNHIMHLKEYISHDDMYRKTFHENEIEKTLKKIPYVKSFEYIGDYSLVVYADTINHDERDNNLAIVYLTKEFFDSYVNNQKSNFLNEYTADDTEDVFETALNESAVISWKLL